MVHLNNFTTRRHKLYVLSNVNRKVLVISVI